MSFVSDLDTQLDEELTVAWRVDPLEAPFQVLSSVRHTNAHHIGVQFLNLTIADRMRLSAFIARSRPSRH